MKNMKKPKGSLEEKNKIRSLVDNEHSAEKRLGEICESNIGLTYNPQDVIFKWSNSLKIFEYSRW